MNLIFALMGGFIYWYKSRMGIGDRLHHVVQLMELAEQNDAHFVVDMRDGMFGEFGEDAFSKWFDSPHPKWIRNPDFAGLLSDYSGRLIPPRPNWFEPTPVDTWLWKDVFLWQRWVFKTLELREWGAPGAWIRKIMRLAFQTTSVQALDTRTVVCSLGPFVRPHRHPGCIHLYDDWIRTPKWSPERMVWPNQSVIDEIESAWRYLSFDPSRAVGIHIRQTDKTQNNWWETWLDELVAGTHSASFPFVFLATDSRRVVEAFENAPMKQQLFCNPWLELPDEETPLHTSNFDGEWVLKTALFDLWTLSQCGDFVPSKKGSSFSRVADAWRKFPRTH